MPRRYIDIEENIINPALDAQNIRFSRSKKKFIANADKTSIRTTEFCIRPFFMSKYDVYTMNGDKKSKRYNESIELHGFLKNKK